MEELDDLWAYPHSGFVVVQPQLEPAVSWLRKCGSHALFAYVRWSCAAIGFDKIKGGLAIHIGPLMLGFVNVRDFLTKVERKRITLGQRKNDGH